MQYAVVDPHTQVTKIELRDDGSLSLTIEVIGFDVRTIVELSGHATQANGAIATFYTVEELLSASPSVVTAIGVPAAKFAKEEVITVSGQARVVRTWGTVLDVNSDGSGWTARPGIQ